MTDRKSLIFDFDGTIAHLFANTDFTETKERMHEALSRHCVTHDLDSGIFSVFNSIREQLPEGEERMGLLQECDGILTECELRSVNNCVLIDGANDTLRALHEKGWKTAIASNNSARCIERYTGHHLPGIDFVIAGRVPGHPEQMKPSPDSIMIAAGKLGVPLSDCIYVGDNPRDWAAACNAGIPFIGLGTTGEKYSRLRKSVRGSTVIRTYRELCQVLSV